MININLLFLASLYLFSISYAYSADSNIKDRVKALSTFINKSTPIQTDRVTTLLGTVAVENTLAHRYVIKGDIAAPLVEGMKEDGWSDQMIQVLRNHKNFFSYLYAGLKMIDTNKSCSSTEIRSYLNEGMIIYYAFFDESGKKLTSYSVDKTDCKNIPTLEALSKKYFRDLY